MQPKDFGEPGNHSFNDLSVFAQPAHGFAGLVSFDVARSWRDNFNAIFSLPMPNPAQPAEAAISEIGRAAIISGTQGGADGFRTRDSASFICSMLGQFDFFYTLASLAAAHKRFH